MADTPYGFDSPLGRRVLPVVLGAAIGISMLAFVSGTNSDAYHRPPPLAVVHHADDDHGDHHDAHVKRAKSYREMRDNPQGHGTFAGDLKTLEKRRDEGLVAPRGKRRAYDGAPPVIPHPIRQDAYPECRACHENGMRIGDKRAPKFSHAKFQSCTQCHAIAEPALPWGKRSAGLERDPRAVKNSFVGKRVPKTPAIPHPQFMHERCESCHGGATPQPK